MFDPQYEAVLRQINDELFLTHGVDRAWLKSLWTPAVRWTEVTEEGFAGGPVMPDAYDGSAKMTAQLRANIARSDRQRVVSGQSVSVRVHLGGPPHLQKTKTPPHHTP